MILTTLFSFLGGSAFRMIWGEVSAMLTARQEHKFEIERLKLQAEADAQAHTRNMEAMRFQHEAGIQVIRTQGEIDLEKLEAATFDRGVETLLKPSGFWLIDAWKSAIQPLLATAAITLLFLHYQSTGWKLDDRGWELVGAILGLFVADRLLFRRGK